MIQGDFVKGTMVKNDPIKQLPFRVKSYSASRDNWCTVGGDGGCRVGEVRGFKGFKLQ